MYVFVYLCLVLAGSALLIRGVGDSELARIRRGSRMRVRYRVRRRRLKRKLRERNLREWRLGKRRFRKLRQCQRWCRRRRRIRMSRRLVGPVLFRHRLLCRIWFRLRYRDLGNNCRL
jgi:hypothetical protein